tara:strand:- start:526 stop:882 length:357 start_codon:yes stop_codon:yes gene_type:complete
MKQAYHGVFCFVQYKAGQRRYDDDMSLWHTCSFVIHTDKDTHYATLDGYTPEKAFQKVKRVFNLKNKTHEIDMIDYVDPDNYKQDLWDSVIERRTVHYPFEKNGYTVPIRYYSIEDAN